MTEEMFRSTVINWRSRFGSQNEPIPMGHLASYLLGLETQVISLSEDFKPHGPGRSDGEKLADMLGFMSRFEPAQGPWALPGSTTSDGFVGHCLLVDPSRFSDPELVGESFGTLGDADPFERHANIARFRTSSQRRVQIIGAYASHRQMETRDFSQTRNLLDLANRLHAEQVVSAIEADELEPFTAVMGDLNTPRWVAGRLARERGMRLDARGVTAPAKIWYSAKGNHGEDQWTVNLPALSPVVQLDHVISKGATRVVRSWRDRTPPIDHWVIGTDTEFPTGAAQYGIGTPAPPLDRLLDPLVQGIRQFGQSRRGPNISRKARRTKTT